MDFGSSAVVDSQSPLYALRREGKKPLYEVLVNRPRYLGFEDPVKVKDEV